MLCVCVCFSLESRDNPFLPGGDLSREAEELLSKATIVRDKFFLEQQERQNLLSAQGLLEGVDAPAEAGYDATDGTLPNAGNTPALLEERISPTFASKAEAAPEAHPRENGKAGDGVVAGGTSPDGVVVEVGASPTADGNQGLSNDTEGEQQDKDKAKRRPKCCVLM